LQSPKSEIFLQFLKDRGYRIRILHVSAPDEVRIASIKKANATFLHVSEKDLKEKGLAIAKRLPMYFSSADEIEFYYRSARDEDAKLAAIYKRDLE